MKKFAKLIFIVLFLCLSLPLFAEEKISNFEVHFTLNKDNTATVKEYITFNAEHNKIKRGLYRQLSYDMAANISINSLMLDYQKCPYTTENGSGFLKINFGTEELLPEGEHTYILTYTLSGVMKTNLFHDFLFWPVTGGAWALPIQKAKLILTVPYSVKPLTKKIMNYTYGIKENKFTRQAENIFVFETSKPLKEGEMFSIYFPIKKGVFKFHWYEIKYMPVFICLLIVIYYFIIWYIVGRDPAKTDLPYRIKPPKGVSAGFASYFLNGKFSSKNLATVLSSLMIKKKINITFNTFNTAELSKSDLNPCGLEEDEALLLMSLPIDFKFNAEGYKYLQKGLIVLNDYYEGKKEDYVINNFRYMFFPIILSCIMLFYFYMQGVLSDILFWGVVNFIIPLIIGIYTKNIKRVIIIVGTVLILSILGISTVLSPKFLADPNVIAIIITSFLSALFVHLINNLMYEGAVLRDELAAFKKYMVIAERGRVSLSDPSIANKIFCDYLPYAYAFGMESEWFDSFKNKLDFRIKDIYGPLVESSLFDIGLVLTVAAAINVGASSKTFPVGLGKGGFGGGAR